MMAQMTSIALLQYTSIVHSIIPPLHRNRKKAAEILLGVWPTMVPPATLPLCSNLVCHLFHVHKSALLQWLVSVFLCTCTVDIMASHTARMGKLHCIDSCMCLCISFHSRLAHKIKIRHSWGKKLTVNSSNITLTNISFYLVCVNPIQTH